MSIAAINWAIALSLPPRDKLTLLVLANRANDAGSCFPSIASIVADTGLAERSVQSAIRTLANGGHLVVDGRGGRGRTSLYRLQMGAPAAPLANEKGAARAPITARNGAASAPIQAERVQNSSERVQTTTVKGAAHAPGTIRNQEEPKEGTLFAGVHEEDVTLCSNLPATLMSSRGEESCQHSGSTIRDEFEATFWPVVPKKVGKAGALKAYETARKKVSSETLSEAMARYRSRFIGFGGNTELQFAKHPDGWLRAERWNDEAPTTPSPGAIRNPNSNQRGGGLLAAVMRSAEAGE